MKINALGHVVLRVADCDRSEAFYHGILGLPVCARLDRDGMRMTFFSLGNHHDFAVQQPPEGVTAVSADTPASPGLAHVAFNIGTSMDQLREAHAHLTAAGVHTTPIDHEVSKSLYFADPDGNGVEVYIDSSDVWRTDPQRVAQVAPLDLQEA